mmetsp:Transcript_28692/g.73326  ORF Transcript_28692/g.73326 Transcript_28692/m.73326 type:complete len:223 (-) Transcript_28692:1899-2567(-)
MLNVSVVIFLSYETAFRILTYLLTHVVQKPAIVGVVGLADDVAMGFDNCTNVASPWDGLHRMLSGPRCWGHHDVLTGFGKGQFSRFFGGKTNGRVFLHVCRPRGHFIIHFPKVLPCSQRLFTIRIFHGDVVQLLQFSVKMKMGGFGDVVFMIKEGKDAEIKKSSLRGRGSIVRRNGQNNSAFGKALNVRKDIRCRNVPDGFQTHVPLLQTNRRLVSFSVSTF